MRRITDILKEKQFTVSIELVPPRNGVLPDSIFAHVERIKHLVDFASVTKGAGGSLRGGTLPLSFTLQQRFGVNAIAHFTCREHTKFEIENELSDLHYFNIKNILALRGDPPAGQTMEQWDGDYRYAYQLVEQISSMNQGNYLPRSGADDGPRSGAKTDFCILVAGHPEDPIDQEVEHMRRKADAGAHAIITQMIFSAEDYRRYVSALRKAGITLPVIAGIRPLTSLKQALSVEQFFNIPVAEEWKSVLKDEAASRQECISYAREMIRKLKRFGAPGVHLFVLNDIGIVEDIIPQG
ncbi:MAG: methylenetetrahydrofolate reductase [Nanoarchaeota archaeon]